MNKNLQAITARFYFHKGYVSFYKNDKKEWVADIRLDSGFTSMYIVKNQMGRQMLSASNASRLYKKVLTQQNVKP